METQEHLWTREGHLTALTLDRLHLEELPAPERLQVQQHLEGCALCRQRQQRVHGFDQALSLPPLVLPPLEALPEAPPGAAARQPPGGRVLPFPRWAMAAAAVAAAAVLLFLVWPATQGAGPQPEDGLRLKGRALPPARPAAMEVGFSWEVFANDEQGTRPVASGDAVHPGERLGFRVHPRRSGHLLIVGVDDRGQDYLCYPQRQQGHAALVAASASPYSLEEAVRLDEVMGHERLLALFCPEPVSLEQIKPGLLQAVQAGAQDIPTLKPGCVQSEITLQKEPAPR